MPLGPSWPHRSPSALPRARESLMADFREMRKQIVTTSSGATNPKPFASLNHVTVRLPSFFLYKFAERATVASRERAMGHHVEQLFMARQRVQSPTSRSRPNRRQFLVHTYAISTSAGICSPRFSRRIMATNPLRLSTFYTRFRVPRYGCMSLAVSPACFIRKRIASILSGRSDRKCCAS